MVSITKAYKSWLNELKQHIHSSQIRTALKVNAELLALYWHLGQEILDKEKIKSYGTKLIDQLSKDLTQEFPQVRGFSRSNLYSIRQWVSFYAQKSSIVQSHFGQLPGFSQHIANKSIEDSDQEILGLLCQIPWGYRPPFLSLQIEVFCSR